MQQIRVAVFVQSLTLWMDAKQQELGSDEPRWIDFKEIQDLDRVRRQRRERMQRMRAERAAQRAPGEQRDSDPDRAASP